MTYAIKVEGVGKEYRIGTQHRPGGLLMDQLGGALRHPLQTLRRAVVRDDDQRFWALEDLDFEVQQGDVLGVVGRNGAGKSTLLKILSRITDPTQGRALVRGRMASLLEVGTGFHPELSGRENIFLNATILGMRRREIERKFDEIVAFSGVERFLDTPVKHYSSGMYVRLAFAVAAHVDADILLVDEVLAVGDAEFQKRCLGKMGEVAKGGRTVLFVSHNLTALRNLCTQGLYLEDGRLSLHGSVSDVLGRYTSHGTRMRGAVDLATSSALAASSLAVIRRASVHPRAGADVTRIATGTPFEIGVTMEVMQPDLEIGVFLTCRDEQGDAVFSTGSFFEASLNGLRLPPGLHRFKCDVPAPLLNDGEYTLDVFLVHDRKDLLATENSLLSFRVEEEALAVEGWHWRPLGVIRPAIHWQHEPTIAVK
jgi:lipopolysaccharide transport system ATP-binding protein